MYWSVAKWIEMEELYQCCSSIGKWWQNIMFAAIVDQLLNNLLCWWNQCQGEHASNKVPPTVTTKSIQCNFPLAKIYSNTSSWDLYYSILDWNVKWYLPALMCNRLRVLLCYRNNFIHIYEHIFYAKKTLAVGSNKRSARNTAQL